MPNPPPPPPQQQFPSRIWRPSILLPLATLLRLALILYSRYQDTHSPLKYTDIDYLVFTDAARSLAHSRPPYDRATYRYTPLLAWLLYPTTWGGWWFESGKLVFALGDVLTGWMGWRVLEGHYGMGRARAGKFVGAVWLLNPMVANISTRGSSEGVVCAVVVAVLWAGLEGRAGVCGALLGLGVHLKIYPFVYAAALWWGFGETGRGVLEEVRRPWGMVNGRRGKLVAASVGVFMGLNGVMYLL